MDGDNKSDVTVVSAKRSKQYFSRFNKFIKRHSIKNKKIRKISYIFILAFILVLAGTVIYKNNQNKKEIVSKKEKALVQSNNDISKHNYNSARQNVQEYLKEDLNDDDRYQALSKLGIILYAQRDNSGALIKLLEAENIKQKDTGTEVLTTVASIYMAEKDNKKAIEYLKKAADRAIATKDPGDDALVPQYEELAKKLGGSL